jgi:hypothetical protein
MSAASVRILVVGNSTASTESTLRVLARSGWESHAVNTVREADAVLRTIRFQLTLATETLPDGTGYELASLIARQTGNLFISVPLSDTCLWLPAVENGVRSLGQRALNPLTLETEAELILRLSDTTIVRPESKRSGGGISSAEVVRAVALPVRTVARLTEKARYGRQACERHEDGEDVAQRESDAPRQHATPRESVAGQRPSPSASEGVIREVAGVGKRWRGL